MSETDERKWNPDRVRVQLARDLRKIEHLYVELPWQAYATTTDSEPHRDRMLGGDALNMTGPIAPIAKWEDAYAEAEAEHDYQPGRWDYAGEQDVTNPLNTLEHWTRTIREERDQPTGLKATLSREIDYLRKNLEWMTRVDAYGEPEWFEVTEVAKDLRAIIHRLESELSMGSRLDRTATACLKVVGKDAVACGGQLVRRTLKRRECEHVTLAGQIADWCGASKPDTLRAMLWYRPDMAKAHRLCDQGGRDDVYQCLDCEQTYTTSEYWLAVREGYERQAGA